MSVNGHRHIFIIFKVKMHKVRHSSPVVLKCGLKLPTVIIFHLFLMQIEVKVHQKVDMGVIGYHFNPNLDKGRVLYY